jgi:RNA polymerase sigma factor (sigma-70 family)
MVFEPHDAEDVTQEVLVKVITNLSTFKGECKFRTWIYRIAGNHVLNMKRRGAEAQSLTFAKYGGAIDNTPDLDLPDPKSVPVEVPLLVEEAKVGCTTGMLLCLDRKQRLIFTLREIFGVSDTIGGEIERWSPLLSLTSWTQPEITCDNCSSEFFSSDAGQCGLPGFPASAGAN